MTFATGMVVYVMIWVVVLFLVLPWGVRLPDKIEQGHADSAPEHPYIGLKFLATSFLSTLLWVIAYLVLKSP
jgi:predicted secreted protein